MKTRHGKLLTATGIYSMSYEEFQKVRTKRYTPRQAGGPDDIEMNSSEGFQLDTDAEIENVNVEDCSNDKMILEELKADIKEEVGAENDSDPELSTILEALSQNCEDKTEVPTTTSAAKVTRVDPKAVLDTGLLDEVKQEPMETSESNDYMHSYIKSEPIPAPAKIYISQHMFSQPGTAN